ncbi:hypothetical protein TruAng_005868 [Truncatella angustata]|nr:hypothetical protein TruAng_005868 [Truncatella angustata]
MKVFIQSLVALSLASTISAQLEVVNVCPGPKNQQLCCSNCFGGTCIFNQVCGPTEVTWCCNVANIFKPICTVFKRPPTKKSMRIRQAATCDPADPAGYTQTICCNTDTGSCDAASTCAAADDTYCCNIADPANPLCVLISGSGGTTTTASNSAEASSVTASDSGSASATDSASTTDTGTASATGTESASASVTDTATATSDSATDTGTLTTSATATA